jgi:hypothetical protein
MPYNNLYNQSIAKEVDFINRKYVSHSDMTGQGTVDYTQSVNLVGGNNPNSMMGCGYSGGVAEYKKSSASKHACPKGHAVCNCDEYESDSDKEMEGGAILGFQDHTMIIPKKQHMSTESMGVKQSFGTLGLDGKNLPKNSRDIVASTAIPAANARTGLASKNSRTIEGGNGFAAGTHMDTGVGVTMGAIGKGRSGGRKKKADKAMEGKGFLSDLGIPVVSNIAGMFGLGKGEKLFVGRMKKKREAGKELSEKERARVEQMGKDNKLEGGFLQFLLPALAPVAGQLLGKVFGNGKSGGMKRQSKKDKEDEKLAMEVKGLENKEGGALLPKLFKAMSGNGRSGGRKKKMVGGTTINTVETVQSTPKMEQTKPVPKAQMPSSTMSGGKGGKSKRAEIVKKVMKEKGLKLIEASKYVKEHNLY